MKLPSLLATAAVAVVTMPASGNRCSGVEMPAGARSTTHRGGTVGLDSTSSSTTLADRPVAHLGRADVGVDVGVGLSTRS